MATDFNFSPTIIFYLLLISVWIHYLIQTYLIWRQRKVLKIYEEIPPEKEATLNQITDDETFKRARNYGLATNSLSLGFIFYYALILTAFLVFDLLLVIWVKSCKIANTWESSGSSDYGENEEPSNIYGVNEETIRTLIFVFILTALQIFIILPVNLCEIYVEEKYGLNKTTVGIFICDLIKSILLKILMFPSSAVGFIVIFQATGRHLWYFLTIAWMLKFIDFVVLNNLFCCLACYNKFKPLEESSLKSRLESLAKQLNFPLKQILIMNGSIRSLHSNAYLYGICCGKRIVLLDTLFAKDQGGPRRNNTTVSFSDDEIEMIVCHEMGHWALNHVWKIFIFSQLNVAVIYILIGFCFNNTNLYIAFGFVEQDQPVIVKLLVILIYVLLVYNIVLTGLTNLYSRKTEFDADAFAVKNMDNNHFAIEQLKSAVIKLHKNNLEFPFVDRFYALLYYTHPNVLSRLEAIEKFERDQPDFV